MKKFLVCNSTKKIWRDSGLAANDEHLIIYCKDLKTIFQAWSTHFSDNVKKITINVNTEDPSLSINPYFMPNLKISTNVREISFNCYTHDYWLALFLSLCPNVEVIYFFKLTKEKIKYLAEHLDRLVQINCDYMEDDLINYYKHLVANDKSLNGNIKIN